MKQLLVVGFALFMALNAGISGMINGQPTENMRQNVNPFFTPYGTPYDAPPFDRIREEHFIPAYERAMEQQVKEIAAITGSSETPAFDNTIEALERSGSLLRRVDNVFSNLKSAHTNEELQEIAKTMAPKLSRHGDDILLNRELFDRIKAVYQNRSNLELDYESQKLLEETYRQFVRGGANLSAGEKEILRQINEELSLLSLRFNDNVLKADNRFELVIEDRADLAGLPENVLAAAAETAAERGHDGKWVFTLHKPSLIPFLQYSEKRALREKMLKGYITRGDHDDAVDNKKILRRMASLRVKRANLLGYRTHADFILEKNMAKTPDRVYQLLEQLWKPALARAKTEAAELQACIGREGNDFKLEPWDWWYYAEKVKKEKYALDDEVLRPYFKLENVRDGAFAVAGRLYGITFTERDDIPVYHPDVKVFEVREADGRHIGLFYTDYYVRSSKRGGAWKSVYRKQSNMEGEAVTPLICNTCNFPRPTAGTPSLLTLENVETLFHEFGHGLHGLLSDCRYNSLSGTSVPRDFVELPSQIMENWATSPEVMRFYARHYLTGEAIPDDLIEKIQQASLFNQGFATVELLAASFLDMDWHTLTDEAERDVHQFEAASMDRIGLIPEIVVRYKSPYFRHIFSGGYSSGYYSYIWAEVLDADAFQAFKEHGLFDRDTAAAFRDNILAAGNSDDPMTLYRRFRGAEPKIYALLERRGLN